MLWLLVLLLLVLWGGGLLLHIAGMAINILLVLAVIVAIASLLRGAGRSWV